MRVNLFNKGHSLIHGHDVDEKDGKLKPYAFRPQTAIAFSEKEAAKLKKLYPKELLSVDDIKSQFDGVKTAADSAPVQATPAMNNAEDDPALRGLSEQERALVIEMRARTAAKASEAPVQPAQPPAPVQAQPEPAAPVSADPSAFVNVTEEEGRAAMAAIEAVRAEKARLAAIDAQAAQPQGLLDKVKSALGVNGNTAQ